MFRTTRNSSVNSFNCLPPHVVTGICDYLDGDSLFKALIVFKNWHPIIATSSKFLEEFNLNLNEALIAKWRVQDLPIIPIKNVTISYESYEKFSSAPYVRVLTKYKSSIKKIVLTRMRLRTKYVKKLLDVPENLTELKLDDVEIFFPNSFRFALPNLKSLTIIIAAWDEFDDYAFDFYKDAMKSVESFEGNSSIEKLHLELPSNHNLPSIKLNNVVRTMPNLKEFYYKEEGYYPMHVDEDFPAKLEKLEISPLSCDLDLLSNQKDTLKDLVIFRDEESDSDSVHDQTCYLFDFILKNMELRNFICSDYKVIINYERLRNTLWWD